MLTRPLPSPLTKHTTKVVAARSWGEVQVQHHATSEKPTCELCAVAPTPIQAIRKLRQLMDAIIKEDHRASSGGPSQ